MLKVYKKFYEMDIWKDGYELQKEIFELVKVFPKEEVYGLISQFNRSANSILANIAEAHGRYHYADRIRVLYISRGEIEETQSHLLVASSRGYITEDKAFSFIERYENLKKKVNGYINNLSQEKNRK